ncbi:MAG: MucB/RseB [Gammaproteobacteria bacterium]|nr:MucB/RseB [Gammaproteobacteria bacterium]
MRKSRFVLPICLLIVPALVRASDDQTIENLLQKMHYAAHMLNYTGRFVYQQDRQLSLMSIAHAVTKDGEREKLVSLDETGREVIRNGDQVTCIYPDSKSVMVEKSSGKVPFPPTFPVKLDQLKGQYTFHLDRQDKIAGQQARRIIIQPTDKYRYGHRLWVDEKTGLLLKTQLLDESGKLLEQFMFTHIEFMNKVPDELLTPRPTGKEYTWHEAQDSNDPDSENEQRVWIVSELPRGFVSDTRRYHRLAGKTSVEHLVFSDGLASVSVFIEKDDDQEPSLMGVSRMGAVNAFGRMLDDYHITTVGEVPRRTVRMIGESVVYKTR